MVNSNEHTELLKAILHKLDASVVCPEDLEDLSEDIERLGREIKEQAAIQSNHIVEIALLKIHVQNLQNSERTKSERWLFAIAQMISIALALFAIFHK